MSLTLALTNGLSGLIASQGALSVVSRNVANANTVGYSRQEASLEQTVIAGEGAGVNLANVSRVVDEFLIRQKREQGSVSGAADVTNTFLQVVQARFGTPQGNSTISNELSDFATAIDTLANNPEDPALRFAVIAAAQSVSRAVSGLATTAQDLRGQADQEIKQSVDIVNAELRNVFELNQQIQAATLSGNDASTLKDQRDLAVVRIAEQVDISTFVSSNGAMSILTGRGQSLIENELFQLQYTPAASVNGSTVFGALTTVPVDPTTLAPIGAGQTLVTSGTSATVTSQIDSGRLKGLFDLRDGTLNDLADQVDTLANAVREQYNAAHNAGVAFPPPNALTGTRAVASSDAFAGTGTMRVAVVDANGAVVGTPADIDLAALGATTVGGLVTAINAALGADGTAAVVNGKLTITATNSANGIAINEGSSQVTGTTQAFSHYFGLNDLFTGSGAIDFAVNTTISSNPARLVTARLSTTATTGQTAVTIGDNSAIQQLGQVTDLANSFSAVGGLLAGTFTLGEYAAAITGLNAARGSEAEARLALEQDLQNSIDHRAASFSGVNVDEEMANMIILQNAFSASAKVMTTANEMLDTLLQMV